MVSSILSAAPVVTTRHGRPVTVRAARPDDVPLLADLVYCVSARSRWLRYFQPLPPSLWHAWAEGRRMARQPAERALTLVATVPDGPMTAAVAAAELAYDPLGPGGELAILVRDDYQGQGLGAALGRLLVALAQARGLAELHGHILPDNRAALKLIRRLGIPARTAYDGDLIHVVLRLTPLP
jgi:RimJ/RimL family protein N-acetyltransferase